MALSSAIHNNEHAHDANRELVVRGPSSSYPAPWIPMSPSTPRLRSAASTGLVPTCASAGRSRSSRSLRVALWAIGGRGSREAYPRVQPFVRSRPHSGDSRSSIRRDREYSPTTPALMPGSGAIALWCSSDVRVHQHARAPIQRSPRSTSRTLTSLGKERRPAMGIGCARGSAARVLPREREHWRDLLAGTCLCRPCSMLRHTTAV